MAAPGTHSTTTYGSAKTSHTTAAGAETENCSSTSIIPSKQRNRRRTNKRRTLQNARRVPKRGMKVFQALAKAFAAEGTTSVFGMMGDGNMYWMEALHDLGVNLLEVRHEGAGLGMADGWARATHTPGVCTATCGPGVTQLATALVTAARGQSKVVAFVGEAPTTDQDYVQRFDQSRFAAACEAGFVRVLSPDTAYEAVRKAFYQASLESRPVLLSAPMDIQQKTMDDDEAYVTSRSLLPAQRVYPSPDAIARAADIVASAHQP